MISYDLRSEQKDYFDVEKAIRNIDGKAYRVLESQWIVQSSMSEEDVFFSLVKSGAFTSHDRIMVNPFLPSVGFNLLADPPAFRRVNFKFN